MNKLLINKQTEAEKDDYLIECFHDSGLIKDLLSSSYSIVSGRKGSGKTAIAQYLKEKSGKYNIDFVYRLSIRNFSTADSGSQKNTLNNILSFIIIKTIQELLRVDFFDDKTDSYWNDFLEQNGLQNVSDYETFTEKRKTDKKGFSLKIGSLMLAKMTGGYKKTTQKERVIISSTPSSLYEALRQTPPNDKKVIVFIDDISDYLDESRPERLQDDINIIKDLLLHFQTLNTKLKDSKLSIRFISLVRDDLFEFMQSSNTNKLESDSLNLQWKERDFASLLIRRMPLLQNDLEQNLKDPVQNLKNWFPDSIFEDTLKQFSTKRYGSGFYAYMAAISFNRPRDFLQFCYALRHRLSTKHPATFSNIESAEIEYTDYFSKEIRDELYVVDRLYRYNLSQDRIDQLIHVLSRKEKFKATEIRTELQKFIGSMGKKKVEALMLALWRYSIIGILDVEGDKKRKIIEFKHLSYTFRFNPDQIKKYIYYLHRGLWWFSKKKHSKR